jgi:hypothetical protein
MLRCRHQPSAVDGEPEAWFNPVTTTQVGGDSVGRTYCSNTYKYPNIRAGGTLWVRALRAITRHFAPCALASHAFFTLSSRSTTTTRSPSRARTCLPASLASTCCAPRAARRTRSMRSSPAYDFPLALQDRSFKQHLAGAGLKAEVCLCYSTVPGDNGLRLGTWEPEWAGRVAVVNGKVWPVLEVAARPYRFRLLAGANARTWNLKLRAVGGANVDACDAALSWYQIGTEGGLYSASRCAHACVCADVCVSDACAARELTLAVACAPTAIDGSQ